MKLSFVIFLISICIVFSCHAAVKTEGIIHLTDSNYAVIPYTKADSFIFKNAKPAMLTKDEIQSLDTFANTSIDEHNKQTKWDLIDKKNYKVQLVPVINEKGEKEVWLNCFCWADWDWRKYIYDVDDGGSCYFNLKINLSTGKYYDLWVNANVIDVQDKK